MYEVGQGLLRALSEGLLPLGGVDAPQADLVLGFGDVEEGRGVAVGDSYNLTVERDGAGFSDHHNCCESAHQTQEVNNCASLHCYPHSYPHNEVVYPPQATRSATAETTFKNPAMAWLGSRSLHQLSGSANCSLFRGPVA